MRILHKGWETGSAIPTTLRSFQPKTQQNRIFNGINVVAWPATGFPEAEGLIQGQRRLIRSPHFQRDLSNPQPLQFLGQWGQDIRADGDHLTMAVADETSLPDITRYLVAQGVDVYAITPERISLEEMFIQTVGTDGSL